MIAKIRPKQAINDLIGNCAGKVENGNIKLQCTWSKVLRFAPGLKFRPDELFEVFWILKISILLLRNKRCIEQSKGIRAYDFFKKKPCWMGNTTTAMYPLILFSILWYSLLWYWAMLTLYTEKNMIVAAGINVI